MLSRHFKTLCFQSALALAAFVFLPELAEAQPRCAGADGCIARGVCAVLGLATGSLGAVVMSVAGLVSIISASMGMYRTTVSVLVIGAGTWLIEPLINLFYGFPVCAGWDSTFRPLPLGG